MTLMIKSDDNVIETFNEVVKIELFKIDQFKPSQLTKLQQWES